MKEKNCALVNNKPGHATAPLNVQKESNMWIRHVTFVNHTNTNKGSGKQNFTPAVHLKLSLPTYIRKTYYYMFLMDSSYIVIPLPNTETAHKPPTCTSTPCLAIQEHSVFWLFSRAVWSNNCVVSIVGFYPINPISGYPSVKTETKYSALIVTKKKPKSPTLAVDKKMVLKTLFKTRFCHNLRLHKAGWNVYHTVS